MRDTENVLKSSDNDARDAQAALEHHDDTKRPRARGEHGTAAAAPSDSPTAPPPPRSGCHRAACDRR